MNATRAITLVTFALLSSAAVTACTESKSNPTLRPYSGPRDSGVDATAAGDDGTDASSSTDTGAPADAGIDTAPAFVDSYLSDLNIAYEGGYGPVEKDMSNGDINQNDGVMQKIATVPYMKGLGAHSVSKVTLDLGGQYKRFLADVGVDDETMGQGTVVFRVVADGAELFNSDVMKGNDPAKNVDVDISGKNTLELFVDDGGDDNGNDHADWANARVRK